MVAWRMVVDLGFKYFASRSERVNQAARMESQGDGSVTGRSK